MLLIKELWAKRKSNFLTLIVNFISVFLLLVSNILSTTIFYEIENSMVDMGLDIKVVNAYEYSWKEDLENRCNIEKGCVIYQCLYGERELLFVDEDFFTVFEVEISGKELDKGDFINNNNYCLVANNIKDDENVLINGASFIIKGVINASENIYFDLANCIILPHEYRCYFEEVSSGYYFKGVNNVKDVLNEYLGEDNYVFISADEEIKSIEKIFEIIKKCINIVMIICFISSLLNLINHMLLNVKLRSYEIGIKKSVGATNFDIYKQFLLESVLFIVISLCFSLLIINIIGIWVKLVKDISYYVAIVLIIIFALISGLYPAYKASKVDIINCLKKGID